MFSQIKMYLYGGLALIAVIAIGVGEYKLWHNGYDLAKAEDKVQYEKLINDYNEKAIALQNLEVQRHNAVVELQNKKIEELVAKKSELEKKVKENNDAASKEPNANEPALGKSSSVRLNSIR